jgi:hypothetical protein
MRCPNPVCREVFEVPNEPEPPPESLTAPEDAPSDEGSSYQQDWEAPSAAKPKTAGSVGDVVPILDAEVLHESSPEALASAVPALDVTDEGNVPILPAEVVEELPPAGLEHASHWHTPPPVRNPRVAGASAQESRERKTPAVSKTKPATTEASVAEAPPSWELPPPVRRPVEGSPAPVVSPEDGQGVQVFESAIPSADEILAREIAPPPSRARRTLWVIASMVVGAGLIIAIGAFYAVSTILQREQTAFVQVQQDYANGKYASAAERCKKLIDTFPRSEYLPLYEFLRDLSELRNQVFSAEADPRQARVQMNSFLETYQEKALAKEYAKDIRETVLKIAGLLATQAEQEHDRTLLAQARDTLAGSGRFRPEISAKDQQPIQQLINQADLSIAKWQKHQDAIAQLKHWLNEPPSVELVRQARNYLGQQGFQNDPEALGLISQMEERVRRLIRYVQQKDPLPRGPVPTAVEPSLLIASLVAGSPPASRESRRVVPALVRGVLYALDQLSGEELWATRVGIDTVALPVRLPSTPSSPELFLVLSADSKTLMALETRTGKLYWYRELSAPCLGRPVVVDHWAYVPTYDGKVYEIGIAAGNIQGYFDLGPVHLTVGGVWQEGTDFLYIPGDSDHVYVLDLARTALPNQPARPKQCVAILNTGHPSGSLRSEPIIINRVDPYARDVASQAASPSYLILNQADGLDHMKLRVFSLPIDNPDTPPILQPEPRIGGWAWFQPYYDTEKLAFVTDAGTLGLFGIRQVRNVDPPLFPELLDESKAGEPSRRLGRAQVVHALENTFWILANDDLQCLHFDLFTQKVMPLWSPSSLHLGSPLHASQVDENGKTLFVVTQDPHRQSHLATAVEAETGRIVWQRQLGYDGLGDPVVLGRRVLSVDRGGGLARFESGNETRPLGQGWRLADPVVAKPLGVGATTCYLLPVSDGNSVYEIASVERGTKLTIRKYTPAREGRPESLEEFAEKIRELPAPLAGPPSLGPRSILLSLAGGFVQRLSLDGSQQAGGPNWRAPRADQDARGYVVHLGADDFLTTDGSRGVTHWVWPQDGGFQAIRNKVPTAELPARIVAAPVVLPRTDDKDEFHVCVADADDNLTLLVGATLNTKHTWPLGGKITAGPFVRNGRIGCIVTRHLLVWIDPARPNELWRYDMKGEGIVGQPQLIGKLLVVADESGRFVGLDPETGLPRGAGYSLKVGAAPAATPVAFGPDQAFVPLTDGTVFLLALSHLHDPSGPGP